MRGLISVRDKAELRSLIAYLRHADRLDPVIGLSRVPGSGEPWLSVEQLRSVVGVRPRLYFIPSDAMQRLLAEGLGQRLALRAGAIRIWWPALTNASDDTDHPLVEPLEGEGELVGEFARVFRISHPDVRRELALIDGARKLAEEQADGERRRAKVAEHGLLEAHGERNTAILRVETLEADPERLFEMSTDMKLHTLIAREWRSGLSAQAKREHPLRYILSEQFVSAVAQQPELDVERLAWACAMVACMHKPALLGLARQQAERPHELGGKRWRCMAPGSQSGVHSMLYRVLAGETVEFEALDQDDSATA